MKAIDHNTITEVALEQMDTTPDPRLKQIMASLVRHLHDFAREVDLTPEEWIKGIEFLTAVGRTCTPSRQEFILLSDTLGLSSLVNKLHDKRALESGTRTSLLGPFYRNDSPHLQLGDSMSEKASGKEIVLFGTVTDTSGKPIANASVEIWQTDEEGIYDMQRDENKVDLRGHFYTGNDGRYYCRAVTPLGYTIPMDGPVGDMVHAQHRHGYRPAHIHFLAGAEGYRELVTALYLADDEHIDSDTVFGVTESLITSVQENNEKCPIPGMPSIEFNMQLAAASTQGKGRVGADPKEIVRE